MVKCLNCGHALQVENLSTSNNSVHDTWHQETEYAKKHLFLGNCLLGVLSGAVFVHVFMWMLVEWHFLDQLRLVMSVTSLKNIRKDSETVDRS